MTVARPRISLISLGGTISCVADGEHEMPTLAGAELLGAVPGIEQIADVVPLPGKSVGGHALTLDDQRWLAEVVEDEVKKGAAGVVVSQGTDTLEETAYALALQVNVPAPVVLTGAMRTPAEPGADGPANLAAAVRVALSPEAAGIGPLVVIQDEIHLASSVSKVHTSRVAAFASHFGGGIGEVIEETVHFHARPAQLHFLGRPDRLSAAVEVVYATIGADPRGVEAVASYADGLVVAGFGGGHVPPLFVRPLADAVGRGTPVLLASRCLDGPVLRNTYGAPGSEVDLISKGLLPVGSLSPVKARLRLVVALGLGLEPAEVFPIG